MKKYTICMKTPIGVRHGTMEVSINNSKIEGIINILGNNKPISGMVDSEGNCTIDGKLTTLFKDISYTAIGKITDTEIDLSLEGGKNIFKITGKVLEKEENN